MIRILWSADLDWLYLCPNTFISFANSLHENKKLISYFKLKADVDNSLCLLLNSSCSYHLDLFGKNTAAIRYFCLTIFLDSFKFTIFLSI